MTRVERDIVEMYEEIKRVIEIKYMREEYEMYEYEEPEEIDKKGTMNKMKKLKKRLIENRINIRNKRWERMNQLIEVTITMVKNPEIVIIKIEEDTDN